MEIENLIAVFCEELRTGTLPRLPTRASTAAIIFDVLSIYQRPPLPHVTLTRAIF